MSEKLPFRFRRAVATMAALVALTGCSGSTSKASTTTAAPGTTVAPIDTLAPPQVVNDKTATVRAIDNDFEAKHLQIHAGTTVRFLNAGHNKHNIIPTNPGPTKFGKGENDFPTGSSYTATFDSPGTYPYYCSLHATPTAGSMRGVITVTR